jgi:hypothetical protein
MNLADVFTVLFLILGIMGVFVAYWLLVAGLFPRLTERCAAQMGDAPWASFGVGVVGLGPLLAFGIFVSKNLSGPMGKLAGLLLVLAIILTALTGAAGLALRIGQGLRSKSDETDPWRRVLRGSVVLALTLATFIMIPLVMAAGFGSLVMTQLRRSVSRPEPTSHET